MQLTFFTLMLSIDGLYPPESGPMQLVPLDGRGAPVINLAVRHGAALLAAGPLPGSVIVRGDRRALMPLMLQAGAVVTAATAILCGAPAAPARRSY